MHRLTDPSAEGLFIRRVHRWCFPMHVKSPEFSPSSAFATSRQPSYWHPLCGFSVLSLIVLADTAAVALVAWFATRHFASLGKVDLIGFTSVYWLANTIFACRGAAGAWGRNRLIVHVALILGASIAEVAARAEVVLPVLVWLVVGCVTALLIERITGGLRRRAVGWLRPVRSIAFIGNSPAAARMLVQLEAENEGAIDLIGFFDDRHSRTGALSGRIPRLGGVEEVVGYLQEHSLSEVFIALPWSASERMAQLLERLRFLPLTVRLIPDHVPPSIIAAGRQRIDDVIMPTLMVPPFSSVGGFVKRCIDLMVSCILIVPLMPLFVLVGVVIRLDSKGPVFFRQARSGQFGRSFMIYKFRTLHSRQADAAAETLVTHGDSRVTRVGRFLRKYSIDELPQIFNVLLGDMSLVGPRPHAPRAKANGRVYSDVLPDYALRYRVKPGMTGWAQVNGWRGNTDTEDQLRRRVEFDFDYIGRWSIWRDFDILVRTVPSMLLPPANNA